MTISITRRLSLVRSQYRPFLQSSRQHWPFCSEQGSRFSFVLSGGAANSPIVELAQKFALSAAFTSWSVIPRVTATETVKRVEQLPGNDPGVAAQHHLSNFCEINVGGSQCRRGTGCLKKHGRRSSTRWMFQVSTESICWAGQFRCLWPWLARRWSRRTREPLWPLSLSSQDWRCCLPHHFPNGYHCE